MSRRNEAVPQISLNKLCEFMSAKAPRQRAIVRDQKYPTDFKGMYYRDAEEAVAQCIASRLEDTAVLHRQLRLLNQRNPETVGTQRRVASNIDAIEGFQEMLDDINLGACIPRLGEPKPAKLTIRNVQVSVRPEILLTAQGRSGTLVGAIKLHFPKTHTLDDDAGGYVSAVLQDWCSHHLADEGTPFGDHCYVIDVGARRVHRGVKATQKRLSDIADACENYAAIWHSLTPD